jgi:hypothetical protein
LETEAIAEDVTEEEGALQDMEDIERETELTEEQKEEAPQTSQNPKERIMAMLAAQQAAQ